ncbi:polysaccharide biosynthesis/export family protein [Thauera sp. Sel9]|uniref:polysaccharide biosynthesis/export family protein n=1 Tax=Thauera sp. Sel9 TaxID=2974299 RepID=UPI0021E10889|nr:polysaccharide biosynthesis/export family protein [Thauera sp. Sel9]MCV2216241.1 polysaccharide biosynthesis/export family protein [Thauera sp. Sel9]
MKGKWLSPSFSGLSPAMTASGKWFVRTGLIAGLAGALSACTVIPGTSAWDMRTTSSVPLPIVDGEARQSEPVPDNVTITPITADLIIAQARNGEPGFRATQSGGRTAVRPATVPDFGLVHQDYVLGPGDIINVIVWDHPEITIPAGSYRSAEQSGTLVADDGTIFFPYAGTLNVAGKTPREVREILSQRLSKVIENVQLDVRVVAFRSKRVYVVGEVREPGLQPINDIKMTLVEAINRAGGITTEADHGNVLLTRSGQTWRVDLQALYEDGDVSQNVELQPGDIVNVPDRQLNKIFVLGEVREPGSFVMNKRRTTLAEALSEAGFVNQITSDPSWIYVMRSDNGTSELFHLNASSPDSLLLAEGFPLRPRDIVYVDVAAVARWNRVVSNILPTSQMLNLLGETRYPLFNGRQ